MAGGLRHLSPSGITREAASSLEHVMYQELVEWLSGILARATRHTSPSGGGVLHLLF